MFGYGPMRFLDYLALRCFMTFLFLLLMFLYSPMRFLHLYAVLL